MRSRPATAPLALAFVVAALTCPPLSSQHPEGDASREAVIASLNRLARERLEQRARDVAALTTADAVRQRQAQLRAKVLELIGGLPGTRGDLAVKTAPTLQGDGFTLERVIYDSMPGLHVTANVYVPSSGTGPFPAILLSPGHSPGGKTELYDLGGNLARAGFVALAWDPIGQGERLQHFDPDLGASKVGRPTGEHGHDGVQTVLLGEHVSRYFIWDAMRGIDYLATRRDVDPANIGAFGCSGGGTVTAYLAALDPRVKAAASACYMTSFDALLRTAGPQEGEQSIPRFLEAGLDFGDWILLAAPRAYAIVSTTEDMFPFEGAKRTFEEAKRFYAALGAGTQIHWITGPGGHGALGPLYGEIIGFFAKTLGRDGARPTFARLPSRSAEDFLVTETGQVSTSLEGATIQSINRARAASLPAPAGAPRSRDEDALRIDIRALTGITAARGDAPVAARHLETRDRGRFQIEQHELAMPGGPLTVLIAVPRDAGPRPVVLMLHPDLPAPASALDREIERLASSGTIAVIVPARPWPAGTEEIKSPLLGSHYLLSLRAMLVGRTLLGLRADDALRTTEWLLSRREVDPAKVTIHGTGPLGAVALHVAALDARLSRVVTDGAILTWRAIVDRPLHRNASEVVVPGVLRRYDLPDLMRSVAPRPVVLVNPVDAMANPLRRDEAVRFLSPSPGGGGPASGWEHVRIVWRAPGSPLMPD